MFNDEDDVVAYEDELYREASSSDESIDSEVEFHLYSQVHYSQSHRGTRKEEPDGPGTEDAAAEEMQHMSTANTKEKTNVITISDSDDFRPSDSAIIILSDSLEEDSVNCLKTKMKPLGGKKQPLNQSTPKSLTPRKNVSREQKARSPSSTKRYKGGLVQEVLVIRGSSEDEPIDEDYFLTSDSDQSVVENWMLLGRAKEDGDGSIQLNLHGSRSVLSEGASEMDWSISQKDSEAQIGKYSGRRLNRYYTGDKNVICRNCDNRGHLSKNCPVPKKLPACCLCGTRGHMQYSCPSRYCSNCFLPGHFYQDCTERPLWQKKCHRCAMIGHYADACPEIWRQYHLTVKPGLIKKSKSSLNPKSIVYCCNCGRKGHCSYECKDRRMYSSAHPSCELIAVYDNDYEIQKRNNRAKRKYEELQEAGLLPFQILDAAANIKESTSHSNKSRKKRKKVPKQPKDDGNLQLKAITKLRSKKQKSKVLKHEEVDFPRGRSDENSNKNKHNHRKKKAQHLLFKYPKAEKALDGHSKHKKRFRSKKGNSVTADLLSIKQRKKKIKKENSF